MFREEISFYKELEPITRLVILKALCEVRAEVYIQIHLLCMLTSILRLSRLFYPYHVRITDFSNNVTTRFYKVVFQNFHGSDILFSTQQYDAVAYVNDEMKDGTDVSYFRKNKLTGDGGGVTFWYVLWDFGWKGKLRVLVNVIVFVIGMMEMKLLVTDYIKRLGSLNVNEAKVKLPSQK